MKSRGKIFLTLSVLAAGYYCIAESFIVSPLLAEIRMSFPGAPSFAVDMCYSFSQLACVLTAVLCTPLSRRFSKKNLMLAGALLVAVCGGLGGLVHSLAYVLAMRFLCGAGVGLCATLIPLTIAELFNEADAQRLMGWQASFGCVCGMIGGAASGRIAVAFGWEKSYFLYFFFLAIFFLQLFCLPGDKPRRLPESVKSPRVRLPGKVIVWGIVVFFFAALSNCLFVREAELFLETGVGDAAMTGLSQSIVTVGSFFGGVFMAWLRNRIKAYIEPFCWVMVTASCLLIAFTGSAGAACVGSVLYGVGYGVFFPWFNAKGTQMAQGDARVKSLAYINALYFLGKFLSVFIYQGAAAVFKDGSALLSFKVMLAGCVIMTALSLVSALRSSRAGRT